ncbi:ABC transporter substrate-binding protein [Prescottella subtropica]|uniref:ABC transporter substrate-binding protein n=1 Tax=Prescottella subtropica TaxID=2545757 RepID=UPI0010F85972|nr:ABC transporter substrate-binding protein [Prescottella subtropica]
MPSSPSVRLARRATVAAAAAALAVAGLAGCSDTSDDDASTIVRKTTAIAGAGVVTVERDTSGACAAPTPADPGVPDPQRIVVLDSAALDAVCALGMWDRVVGATVSPVDGGRPSYLGAGIAALPDIGPEGAPDVDRITAAAPDLVLASAPLSADLADRVIAAVPTGTLHDGRFGWISASGDDPSSWEYRFRVAGAALGRSGAARQALDDYTADAARTGDELGARLTQTSVIRFGADAATIEGPGSFAGRVLADIGVARPQTQRIETATAPVDDLAAADGDLIYVGFDGPAGLAHGTGVLESDAWLDLGAATDHRVFAVDDEVWNAGNGIVAARAVITDVRSSLNGYAP